MKEEFVCVRDLQDMGWQVGQKDTAYGWRDRALGWLESDGVGTVKGFYKWLENVEDEREIMDAISDFWSLEFESLEQVIEQVQSKIRKGRIQNIEELERECDQLGLEKGDIYDRILSPMEWNSCDKCGALGESDGDFLWSEGFDWDESDKKEKKLRQHIEEAWAGGEYWSAICWECVKELKEELC